MGVCLLTGAFAFAEPTIKVVEKPYKVNATTTQGLVFRSLPCAATKNSMASPPSTPPARSSSHAPTDAIRDVESDPTFQGENVRKFSLCATLICRYRAGSA